MSEVRPATKRWRRGLVTAVLIAFLAIGLRAWLAPEVVYGTTRPIRFDDFRFSVLGSREAEWTVENRPRTFLIVTLKVENQARRVPYRFDRRVAVMVGDDGRESGISPEGQAILDRARGTPDPLTAPLPAGASATSELVFELPRTARNPRLKISHGGRIGDVLDDAIYGRRRLAVR